MQSSALSLRCVHKFGGASLADGECIRRVGDLLVTRAPDRPIVVVSAVEGVTSQLELLAHEAARGLVDMSRLRVRHRSLLAQLELDPEHLNRHFAELATVLGAIRSAGELTRAHLDHVLSFGERASARIVAAHLSRRGLRAMPIDAYDLGLITDSNHGGARVLPQSAERIRGALARIDAICVITGFVAADASGRLTTLGRNGSDVSAALIAEAIEAREVVFWKEVEGVMTADPKLVPGAERIERLSYAEARELTHHGARVLHPEAVEVLERAALRARVCCTSISHAEGTLVDPRESERGFLGIASRSDLVLARLRVSGGIALELVVAACARHGVEPLTAWADARTVAIVAPAGAGLQRALEELGADTELTRDVASVSIADQRDVDAEVERILAAAGVTVLARWRAGPRSSRVLAVPQPLLAPALRALHDALRPRLSPLRDVS